MKIKFEMRDGLCVTPCPNGMVSFNGTPIGVASVLCQNCEHYDRNDATSIECSGGSYPCDRCKKEAKEVYTVEIVEYSVKIDICEDCFKALGAKNVL
jgi:hypothetical protein